MNLSPGQNSALPDAPVTLEVHCGPGVGVDVTALLLDATGKVRRDEDMVFFNNPETEGGAVRFSAGGGAGQVDVLPGKLPGDVQQVVLIASVDVARPGCTFADVTGLRTEIKAGDFAAEFGLPDLTRGETAVVLAELYRRNDQWKIRAVGQGYASGLAGVAVDYGVDVGEEEPPPPMAPINVTKEAPEPPRISMSKEPLGKVDLSKGGRATISMEKGGSDVTVTATLEWDGGDARRQRAGADLDLYALFVPANQTAVTDRTQIGVNRNPAPPPPAKMGALKAIKLAIQEAKEAQKRSAGVDPKQGAVYWNNLGTVGSSPYIQLQGDARVPGIETIKISRPQEQGFILICAYSAVANGAGSFKSYGAKAVVTDGRGSTVTAPLYDDNKTSYWVAVALIDFTDPDGVGIQQIEAYSRAMSESRPVLNPDGSFGMDLGPVEFKRDGAAGGGGGGLGGLKK